MDIIDSHKKSSKQYKRTLNKGFIQYYSGNLGENNKLLSKLTGLERSVFEFLCENMNNLNEVRSLKSSDLCKRFKHKASTRMKLILKKLNDLGIIDTIVNQKDRRLRVYILNPKIVWQNSLKFKHLCKFDNFENYRKATGQEVYVDYKIDTSNLDAYDIFLINQIGIPSKK